MRILTGNQLKLLAALFMVLDHVGVMFFPQSRILRILGRLAYPIFAYMIAEGCRYTRSRRRYWGMLFGLGAVCQVVYYLFDGSLYFSILMTFSAAIPLIFALDGWKARRDFRSGAVFLGALAALWWLNRQLTIDYGFFGCVAPAFASLPNGTKYDSPEARISCFGLGLTLLALSMGGIQWYSLGALALLYCYNGLRGKWKMKYFFYIFYPAHLVALQAIAMLLA